LHPLGDPEHLATLDGDLGCSCKNYKIATSG
jgi:hypothetical protein